MSKVPKYPAVVMPTVEEDKAITAAARNDPDALPLTPKQLKSMVPIRKLRGRPKSGNRKLLVSVRYSPEVVGTSRPRVEAGNRAWTKPSASTLNNIAQRRQLVVGNNELAHCSS